jgi:hypothetical protein
MDKIIEDITKWYNKDKYTRFGSDVSVTELLRPVRVTHLYNRYRQLIKKPDLKQVLSSFLGMGIHDQLQRYLKKDDKWLVERRLLSVIDGVRLAGRFDAMYDYKDLYDIKFTKVYKYMKGDFSEWEQQLNMYDYMAWKDGIELSSLKIMMIFADWQLREQWKEDYPSSVITIVPVSQWSRTKQESFIKERILMWKSTQSLEDTKLPLCTQDERWADPPLYKVYRVPTHTRASKVFKNKTEAENYLKDKKSKDSNWSNATIKSERSNAWRRCVWCDVSGWCNQFVNKLEP